MSIKKFTYLSICIFALLSCSVNKLIPEGEYLLDDVKVISTTNRDNETKARGYIRQNPNVRWFSLAKVPLFTYSLSGADTAKWGNKVLRRLGEAPVIYSDSISLLSRNNIERMLVNDGYLHASVDFECEKDEDKRRATTYYYLHERERYYIESIELETEDETLKSIILADTVHSLLRAGVPFSVDNMEFERRRITAMLKDMGYYRFQKEYITYVADTAHHSNKVRLTMNIGLFMRAAGAEPEQHKVYRIGTVSYIPRIISESGMDSLDNFDTMRFGAFSIIAVDDPVVRPSLLLRNTYILPDELFSQSKVDRTYNAFGNISVLKYPTIRMIERPGTDLLDCYIMYDRNKRRSIGFELEGTNTAGDFGAAAAVTFSDKNLFKGAEQLSIRLFTAYEAVSGLSGYSGGDYLEYGAEANLRLMGGLPEYAIPAKNREYLSSTLYSLKFNSQKRPEFDRHVLSGSWNYTWSSREESQNTLELLDVNYIYVPWISDTFKKEYLDSISNRNSILKYNYENLLITKFGYTYTYNSSLKKGNQLNPYAYSVRMHAECSGNVLYGFNSMFGGSKNSDGQYTILDLAYAQYVKGDFEITARYRFNDRNTLLFHTGVGIAYPYGNSRILPFEKRYFAGGANGMRGWSVRTLGPGRYRNSGKSIDFINQSGDLKLDINLELRTRLFWKLHTAVFVDAGNIWTLRPYDEQPGGQFDISTFHRELAFSYGVGVRIELDMFVLRLDGAMKAVNPAYEGDGKYPLLHPDFGRDFALHFAIGYPF